MKKYITIMCKMCKDYNDTWDFECFCEECQKLISNPNVIIQ